MARSANDGGCIVVSWMCCLVIVMNKCQDLRNTALGASSPAKPALHIPELPSPSVCCPSRSVYLPFARFWVCGEDSRMTSEQHIQRAEGFGGAQSYPLSMTSAATSSINRIRVSDVFHQYSPTPIKPAAAAGRRMRIWCNNRNSAGLPSMATVFVVFGRV